jgi:Cys-rich protein (TIGR01571 family)
MRIVACFFCVPCFLGRNKAIVDGRTCHLTDVCCFANPLLVRKQFRAKFGYNRADCADCLSFLFCCPCASCQDTNEMERRYKVAGMRWSCCGTLEQSSDAAPGGLKMT